ncbi:MAG TPA: adenylate/guanylate cyclase domain-containing protein [Opitutaceae bacterium]|nr:adenylate/guanylate cyclase domain-containing protein [Opitutaceae bacterium]
MLRFRRFRSRLLALVLGLLAATLLVTYLLVARANRSNAIAHVEERLSGALKVFWFSVETRKQALADSAKVVSADWPLRTLYLQEGELDRLTLASTLASYAERLNAPVIAAFAPDGEMLATTEADLSNEHCGPFRFLISKADEEAMEQNSDFAYLRGRLHVLTVVPLYAPRPNVIGWLGVAFPIDDRFAQNLKETTQAEVTFTSGPGEDTQRVLATTLTADMARLVAENGPAELTAGGRVAEVTVAGEPFVTLFAPLELLGDDPARITLQRSLDRELAPARRLQRTILVIAIAALVLAALWAAAAARSVSRPVQELAAHTRRVAAGDYSARLELAREDELGQLAAAFNQMTAGLAERDRVRDLLGKVVSPEIAAQLMQSDLKLGGEEREVTVLFSDLRDFTTLSEKLPPAEVLALLNRYLDRMSAIVERHGGVIDKYIGDAIMALFGAPVAAPDAAARALAAAREMVAALADLNRELAAEGRPPLQFGIGINTGRVVAGNMGSRSRLNYTVIGDGVNLAARLEALTKDPAHGASIIVSESAARAARELDALRLLGTVQVKGRAEPVRILAVDA